MWDLLWCTHGRDHYMHCPRRGGFERVCDDIQTFQNGFPRWYRGTDTLAQPGRLYNTSHPLLADVCGTGKWDIVTHEPPISLSLSLSLLPQYTGTSLPQLLLSILVFPQAESFLSWPLATLVLLSLRPRSSASLPSSTGSGCTTPFASMRSPYSLYICPSIS